VLPRGGTHRYLSSFPLAVSPMPRIRSRQAGDGIVYISGSGTLVRALLRDGLVDDLHLFVYPLALGAGRKLWGDGVDPTRLALKELERYDNGVVHLDYGPA
jgi:dihydrofolate reductase